VHVVVSEASKPQLVYVASHLDAPENITELYSLDVQPVMSWLNKTASLNIPFMVFAEPRFQSRILPLNAVAPLNISAMFSTEPTFQAGISWLKLLAY